MGIHRLSKEGDTTEASIEVYAVLLVKCILESILEQLHILYDNILVNIKLNPANTGKTRPSIKKTTRPV